MAGSKDPAVFVFGGGLLGSRRTSLMIFELSPTFRSKFARWARSTSKSPIKCAASVDDREKSIRRDRGTVSSRHCEEPLRRSNPFFAYCIRGAMDCFAALAMTVVGCLKLTL
jgi:hypothetical protein